MDREEAAVASPGRKLVLAVVVVAVGAAATLLLGSVIPLVAGLALGGATLLVPQKSFLEANQLLIGAVAIALIAGGSAFALLLQGGLFTSTYHVRAIFSDAAGIVPGDQVTVAGLKAGTVKGMEIEGGHVTIDLAVNTGIDLPADSSANISVQTLLGKETVELRGGSERRLLQDGDTIPLSRTTTPVDITELNDISVRLMNASDAQALNQLLKEVADITAGKRSQVGRLVRGLGDVAAAVDARRTQLGGLIDALRRLSGTLAGRDKTIISLIDNLDPVLANLAARQRQIRTLLEATDSASHETADLVSRNRGVLDSLLGGLHRDLEILDRHQIDLAATIRYLDSSVHGYQSVGYSQHNFPNRWANIFVQSLGPIGVDAFLGQCGAVDQIIDQALGTDCRKKPKPHPTPTVPVPTPTTPLPTPTVSLPVPGKGGVGLPTPSVPDLPVHGNPPLPGDIGDIVDGALAGAGGGGTA